MSKLKILVVDDSALIRQVIADALTPRGYEVTTAADGAEALSLLEEFPADLIIADILMPVMDGWALLERIRTATATRDVPFIFLTTERDVPKRIQGLESGADDYVCKPFSKEELLARAEGVLRRARYARPATTSEEGFDPCRLTGHTTHIAMSDLLQLLAMNGKSGTLHVTGESVARVYFREGQVINAETQGLRGEKALFRVVSWPEAQFSFEPGEPAREVEALLTGGTSSVLMEAFAHLDELRDIINRLPPRSTRMKVIRAMAEAAETMDLSTAQRIMLFTAGGRGASLGEMVDTVPNKDLDAYMALEDLLRRGLVEPWETRASE